MIKIFHLKSLVRSVALSGNVAAGRRSVGGREGIKQGFQIPWMGKRDGRGMGEGQCQCPPVADRGWFNPTKAALGSKEVMRYFFKHSC